MNNSNIILAEGETWQLLAIARGMLAIARAKRRHTLVFYWLRPTCLPYDGRLTYTLVHYSLRVFCPSWDDASLCPPETFEKFLKTASEPDDSEHAEKAFQDAMGCHTLPEAFARVECLMRLAGID